MQIQMHAQKGFNDIANLIAAILSNFEQNLRAILSEFEQNFWAVLNKFEHISALWANIIFFSE